MTLLCIYGHGVFATSSALLIHDYMCLCDRHLQTKTTYFLTYLNCLTHILI